jgi:hypothetical protein
LSFSTPGPLLRSINLQNRGGLTYLNYQFDSFFKELADIATTEILSYLAQENTGLFTRGVLFFILPQPTIPMAVTTKSNVLFLLN